MLTIASTLMAIAILVTIHEFGHFAVARFFNVKVICFSVGFGKALLSWRDKLGTEYRIAAIPLGGFVKMLDSREGKVLSVDETYAFDKKPVAQRIAIVAAGPLINFLFAAMIYGLISGLGTTVVIPVVQDIQGISEKSIFPAEIVKIDGQDTLSWERINIRLVEKIGDEGTLPITLRGLEDSLLFETEVFIPKHTEKQSSPLELFGFTLWSPRINPVIHSIQKGGRGDKGGLEEGDRILFVNGFPLYEWQSFVEMVKSSANQELALKVDRYGSLISLSVTPEAKINKTSKTEYGFLGVTARPPQFPLDMQRKLRTDLLSSILIGFERTIEMIRVTTGALGKMITGVISVDNLSGPVTIARIAGDSAVSGWYSYLSFLAYLSVSLGVLNLLPIPILDGGHLMFFAIEWVKGQPVSDKIQSTGLKFGALILAGFMLLAFYNDLMRELMRF